MSNLSIGQGVKCAVVFLRQFHEDVRALVRTMDVALHERGWQPTGGNRISDELGNAIDGHWVLETLTRFYIPRGDDERAHTVIAVAMEFAPDDVDESIVLCLGAQFATPVRPRSDLWNAWTSSNAAIAYLASRPGPQDLGRGLLDDGFMPSAASARALLLRLGTLVDTETVQRDLVAPALALVAAR